MAKARLYGWSEKRFSAPKKVAELKGQAKVIADTIDTMSDEAHDAGTEDAKFLATDIAKRVDQDGKLVTRQSVERVTLYYILVLKSRGFIAAAEVIETDDEVAANDDTDTVDLLDSDNVTE